MGLSLLQDRAPPLPYLPLPPLAALTPPPPQPTAAVAQASSAAVNNWDNRISPSILLIIAILAIIFFLSGLLHLLIRYLLRPPPSPRDLPDDPDAATTALQGPLQQLFHLHDAGVDQSFIDALPVFLYGAIVGGGNKDPFDCAVCLCEFDPEAKLRLLPKCSHAFHLECIDTWLLSHSTCPLCRSSLLPPEFSPAGSCGTPLIVVLESAGESSREIVPIDSHLGHLGEDEVAAANAPPKTGETAHREELQQPQPVLPSPPAVEVAEAKVVAVKLGKFRNLDPGAAEGSSFGGDGGTASIDGRRCFSMGSFAYVMDETSLLQVAIEPPSRNNPGGAAGKPRRRLAMSECDCHSQREGFKGFDPPRTVGGATSSSSIRDHGPTKKESLSFSKTWLRSRKDRPPPVVPDQSSSRGAFSFRVPPVAGAGEERKGCSKLGSEFDSESEYGFDLEVGSCNGGGGRAVEMGREMPSFARRTLLWVMGRNHKVENHI